MTRVDHAQIAYLQMAENAREGLQYIPQSADRARFVGRHDLLIADQVPLNEIPARMEDLEPNGVSKVDFAVPRFLSSLYGYFCADRCAQKRAGVENSTPEGLWNSAMADAERDVLAYHRHQELLARLQQRSQGPGAFALTLEGANLLG